VDFGQVCDPEADPGRENSFHFPVIALVADPAQTMAPGVGLRYVFGMATTKITITLEHQQVQAIRELVSAGQTDNVSAFVKHAVGIALFDAAGWKVMLGQALQQTGGRLTKKEIEWADRILCPAEKTKRTKRKAA
jgi:Arc/MetJ-type ribon-helix-helix transcriptional regulator